MTEVDTSNSELPQGAAQDTCAWNSKAVTQLNASTGEVICVHRSLRAAASSTNQTVKVLRRRLKDGIAVNNARFRLAMEEERLSLGRAIMWNSRIVQQFDWKTGAVLREFDTLTEAARSDQVCSNNAWPSHRQTPDKHQLRLAI